LQPESRCFSVHIVQPNTQFGGPVHQVDERELELAATEYVPAGNFLEFGELSTRAD
jgi:hypothetical protein